jgi:hypothetical protein
VTKTGVAISGSTLIEFTGLSILVPDTVIYQVAFNNASVASSYQWGVANPPSVGSSDNTFYYRGSSSAFAFGKTPQIDGAFDNPSVTITATPVPEPSAAMALFAIVALTFALHRRITKRTP